MPLGSVYKLSKNICKYFCTFVCLSQPPAAKKNKKQDAAAYKEVFYKIMNSLISNFKFTLALFLYTYISWLVYKSWITRSWIEGLK